MTQPKRLPHRRVIALTGPDTIVMLERLVTNNTQDWHPGEMRYGALLTPQGKLIADYLALRRDDGVLLDVAASAADDLAKRLKLFRLRADVAIEPAADMAVLWGPEAFEASLADPRAPAGGHRAIEPASGVAEIDPATYHRHRVAAGLAEQGSDFDASDVFPSDVNLDRLGGVDYSKGCFVGQEVVSRMYRRGKIRRRTLVFQGDGLAPGDTVDADGTTLGDVTSVAGGCALARLRTDRLMRAHAAGAAMSAGGTKVTLDLPDWLRDEMAGGQGDG